MKTRESIKTTGAGALRRFQLVLIKPSHYDDDGYVIRWWRSIIPSNSLAALYSIGEDAAAGGALGPEVAIDIEAIDETNTRVDVQGLVRRFRAHGGFGLVALVGVQSNQFPRALDIARPFRNAGIAVAIGGFHISGVISMIDGHALGLETCRAMGIAMFAGEVEGRLEKLLQDAAAGRLAPVYDFMSDLPSITETSVPFLPKRYVTRTYGAASSFDAGRGCPYQCSFCTIINVQGRRSRHRSADDVERLVRLNWSQGIHKFFVTDDNFARNKNWEPIFDRLISLREDDGIPLGLMIQVDTLCHKIPRFIEKAKRAGVTRVFIGLESISPDTLLATKKRQNKISEYRRMLLAWKAQGVITLAGYILGFPADTVESIRRDIAVIQRELPIDILEFFCLTPLPGSEDHQKLWRQCVAMDPDLNKYDVEHVCTAHPKMSQNEWEAVYREAWSQYYSNDHMRTLLRRAAATALPMGSLVRLLGSFATAVPIENVHPLQAGLVRLKHPAERRPGLPRPNPWLFWPAFVSDVVRKHVVLAVVNIRLLLIARAISRDPAARAYTDQALTHGEPQDEAKLELLAPTPQPRGVGLLESAVATHPHAALAAGGRPQS
jgi:hypothetical protein